MTADPGISLAKSVQPRHHWTAGALARPCPLCGGGQHAVIAKRMQHGLNLPTVICKVCGLVFTNPVPPRETYERFYREAYIGYYGHLFTPPAGVARTTVPAAIRQRLEWINAVVPLHGTRLLEVGPGLGMFLWWAAQNGCEAIGVDPSKALCDTLATQGLCCVTGSFESAELQGPFDIIVMFHVFEHFYDPNTALQRARELLADGGILVLDVPNILRPFRSLDHYFLRYVHLMNLSPATLKAVLEVHGFSVEFSDEGTMDWRTPQGLFAIARKASLPERAGVPLGDAWKLVRRFLRNYRVHWVLWGQLRWKLHEVRWVLRREARRVRDWLQQRPRPAGDL